jgi:glycosyltransferase involved in cell wall biosynthesis
MAPGRTTSTMKIAFVNDTVYPYSKGGAEKRVWEIAGRLAQREHIVHLFGMKYWDGEDVIVKDGVYLHGVCDVQELYTTGGRRSIWEAIYFAYKLTGPLLKENFDIVDCSNFPYFPCFSAKLHSIVKGSTLVITWLEVWDSYWYEYLGWKGIFGKWIERVVARLSKSMIAISESTRSRSVSIGARGNIEVVPSGVDFEEISAASLSNDNSDIVFAGRLIKDKNVDVLIRAVGLIIRDNPHISCLIIGDGPEKGSLERLAHDLRVESNVRFSGFLQSAEEVFSCMKSSKVFVLPSTREGFGIVVLEANACGLPVITVNHPQNAARDLITDGKNGFLCELNEQDMANKIMMALERAQNMSPDCLGYSKQYSWDGVVDMVEDAYVSALGQG